MCNQLTVEARIIHNMIHYCILPRIGSHSHVSYFDVFLMWCILNGEKIDLAHHIIHHMHDCTKRKGVLPYGMLLTAIFEFFGVPLDDKTNVVAPKPTDVYSEATLRRIGFELDEEENTWVRNETGDKEDKAEEEDEDEDNEGDGQPTHQEQQQEQSTDTHAHEGPTQQSDLKQVIEAIKVVEKGVMEFGSRLGREKERRRSCRRRRRRRRKEEELVVREGEGEGEEDEDEDT